MKMRNRAIVSERGTVTIPEPVREAAHIHPGDLIEFTPQKDRIILRHLIVKEPEEQAFMNDSDWEKFDKLVRKQTKKAELASYTDLEKAKQHSRKLMSNPTRVDFPIH